MTEKIEVLNLLRQMQGLKNENERLSSQLHNVKSLNTKWKKYDDEREEYVDTLTANYQRVKSEVTVLNSFLRDATNDLKTAEKKIADLEQLRDKEIELINADLTIEEQKGFIGQLEDKLSQSQDKFSELQMKFSQLQEEFSQRQFQFEEQVLQVTIDFNDERKERMAIEERYQQLQCEFVTFRASAENDKNKNSSFRDTNDNDFPLDNRLVIASKYSTSNLEETNINRRL